MKSKNIFIITLLGIGILLANSFAYAISTEGFDQYPNFVPKEGWSIKYISLFKQAIKEKYNINDETLNNNLLIISVVKGTQADGFAIPKIDEKSGSIHYLYKLDWTIYNGHDGFDLQDYSGNGLTEQQILESMKINLVPIFTISNIISKEQAMHNCNSQELFPTLKSPWYADNNNINFDRAGKELVFECHKVLNEEGNLCLEEVFNLESGKKLSSNESTCFLDAPGGVIPFDASATISENINIVPNVSSDTDGPAVSSDKKFTWVPAISLIILIGVGVILIIILLRREKINK